MQLRPNFYLFTSFIFLCFSLTVVEAQATPAANPASVITLAYDGTIRDRVGKNNLARNPDGQLDGTFTVTLNAGSGNRTVTQLMLANSAGGVWNTDGGDGFWTLGVANGWDAALVNGNNDAVSLPVADGGEFKIFASEFQSRMFLSGTLFTLFVDFSDGSSATGNIAISTQPVVTQPIVTLAATTPTANEGGASGAFTLTRTGSTASALNVNYTLGGTALAGTHYAALSGSVVIAAGSLTGAIVVVPVENGLADGDKSVVVTVSASAAYSVGSPSATVTVHDNDGTTGTPSITLRFDGPIRDRVGQNNLARNPDGQLDGTFTVTLNAGSGNRTVTQLQLVNGPGGVWNSQGGDGFWTLGAANGWDAALVNGSNDAVYFPVASGGEFKIFAADFQNRMFLTGTAFTLTVVFSDGSTVTGNIAISAQPVATQPEVTKPEVTLTATTPLAIEGGASGAFTLTRTGSAASALTVNYTVAGTALASTHYAALSGSVVIAAGSAAGTVTVAPVENSLADGDKTVVVTLGAGAGYIAGSPSTATVTVRDNDSQSSPVSISLRFDGYLRDRVGQNNLARNPDGQLDGSFTVTLNAGGSNRTVTELQLGNSAGGAWNTKGGDGYWTLGAANGWDAALVNGSNDAVNFPVADGGEFKIFAADYQNRMFLTGTVFTLTVALSDGSTATANCTIAALPVVAVAATTANAFEGGASGVFTVTRSGSPASALTVNYSVGGSAAAGTHYTALSGSAVIAAGALSAPIAVVPVQNSLADGDKTVVMTVSANAAYSVGSPPATITVHDNDGPPGPVLFSSPGIVAQGTTLTVSWNGIQSATNKDWIGLFAAGSNDSSVLAWIYVSCTQTVGNPSASGSCPFVVPSSLANGNYELRLFSNGGSSRLAVGLPFAVTPLDTNIWITTPERAVAAAPKVATVSIARQECNTVFSIPYIQTGNILTLNAAARTIPNGGGVVFVLSDSLGGQSTQWSKSPPFSASYTGLAKGEYRLDAYIVDSSGSSVPGELNHDYATNIGIGDIYVAIGDSITEGYDGVAYNTPPYTSWLQAPVASHDFRNYPQCGISSGFYQDHWQEVSHHISLNNELEAFARYPVFILNEGVAAMTTSFYPIRMNTGQWQDRIARLHPNKWLIHLGTNDKGGSTEFQNSMQTVVDSLKGAYAANGKDIVLAVPQLGPNWQPYINNLISANGLTTGPDFNTFYANHTNLMPTGHPNIPGHEQMARLWAISIMSPRNVAVQQVASGRLRVSWDDLQLVEPTIAGYKVYYGTNPGSLTSVIDVGHVLSTLFDVPSPGGQTYYFAVQGYDNDAQAPNRTSLSSPVGIAIGN